jgi:hypothetical protein
VVSAPSQGNVHGEYWIRLECHAWCHFVDRRIRIATTPYHSVYSRDRNFWKHATHGCPRKSVLMEFPAQTHPEPTPYCSSNQAHPNPVGSSSTIATWYSRRHYLQSCFCQDLLAHPGPPMKSWAHPKPTLNPMGLGFGWAVGLGGLGPKFPSLVYTNTT